MPLFKLSYLLNTTRYTGIFREANYYTDHVYEKFKPTLPTGATDFTCEMISSIIVERDYKDYPIGEWREG